MATLVELLISSGDRNPLIHDIISPTKNYACSAGDTASLAEVELIVESVCYIHVYPEHMSVFDFTYWTLEDTHTKTQQQPWKESIILSRNGWTLTVASF